MVDHDVTTGFADGTFRPTIAVSRQAMAAFLWKLAGQPVPSGPPPSFADVPAGHPFRTAIWWMVSKGITTGYDDGTFQPATAVSRQTAAAFLERFDSATGPKP